MSSGLGGSLVCREIAMHSHNMSINILTLFNSSRISAGSLPGCVSPLFLLPLLFSLVLLLPFPLLSFSPTTHPVVRTAGDIRENCIVFVCLVTVISQHTTLSTTHHVPYQILTGIETWALKSFLHFTPLLQLLPPLPPPHSTQTHEHADQPSTISYTKGHTGHTQC